MKKIKRIIRFLCLFIVFSMLLSTSAFAVTRASDYISTYSGYCYSAGSNTVQVWFDISAKTYVDQLGSTTIHLYESTDNSSWSEVKTFSYTYYPSMMRSNNYTHGSHVSYYSAISGRYYYALITVTVVNGSNSESRVFSTYSIQA